MVTNSRINIILTGQRSGSTLLIDTLMTNNIAAYEEIFLFHRKKWPTNAGLDNIYTYEEYKSRCSSKIKWSNYILIKRYIQLIREKGSSKEIYVKLMYGQLLLRPGLLLVLLKDSNTRFIHWYRKDYRKQYLSQRAKDIVGYSHNIAGEKVDEFSFEAIRLSRTRYLLKYIKRRFLVNLFNLFIKHGYIYEEFISTSSFDDLRLEKQAMIIRRMNLDYNEIFTNYSDFVRQTNGLSHV